MPLGLGVTKGASFVNDWNKDIDRLYQREEYAANVRYQKEQKTRFFAEQIKRGHGSNARVESELNDYYKGLNSELANFVTENPNFETDVNAMQKFLDISDRYVNNGILQQDIQVKQEFDKLRQAVSEGKITETKYHEEMARYNEYIDPVRKGDPYVFTNFKEINGSDYLTNLSKTLGKVQGESYTDKLSGDTMQNVTIPQERINEKIELDYQSDEEARLMMDNEYKKFVQDNPSEVNQINSPTALFKKRAEAYNSVEKVNLGLSYAKQFGLREASKKDGETPYSTFFKTEAPVIESVLKGEDFKEGTADNRKYYASPEIIAATKLNNFKTPTTINASDGILAYVEDKDGIAKTMPWKDNATIVATNATEYVKKGGFLYAKVSVTLQNGGVIKSISDKSGKASQANIDDKRLTDEYGFQIAAVQRDAMIEGGMNMNPNTTYASSPTYKGTLLVPVRIDPSTVGSFERNITTAERAGKTNPYVTENFDSFLAQYPAFLSSKSIDKPKSPTMLNSMISAQTSNTAGVSDPDKTVEVAYRDFGESLPKGSINYHYEPKFGYMAFTYNGILSTLDEKGQVRAVPNNVR